MTSLLISWITKAASAFNSWILKTAIVSIFSIRKSTTDGPSLIGSTTTVADDLKSILERIKAVLVDAETRDILDESVKLWLKEIKDVAYDAEDLLDEYQYHVLRAQVENRAIAAAAATSKASQEEVMPLTTSASSKISVLSSVVDRIEKVRKRFDEISKHRHDLHLNPEDGQRRCDSSSQHPSETSHIVNEQEIYGRIDDKEWLMDWLVSNRESKFEVLVVVGKGGLGKTTLAQQVFNDQKVTDNFHRKMWICVSDDFNLTRLTRAMIESITKESCTLSELSLLQESLHKELQGNRVLLVLDDVWNENKGLWETLSIPLHGAEIVRVIATARNESAAEIMQTTSPYRLGYLSEGQCWQLFLCHAFRSRDPEQFPSLVEVGKKIVKKCDGLPLAVKSLGGLLQYEVDEDKWNEVLQSKVWDNQTNILPALILSYIRMPTHLKPCFEICSIFPKDFEFRKDYLIKLWVAHGYIQHSNGEEENAVKEIGYTYFSELHRRSFFDKFDKYGENIYKMHDNIHDIAHYVQLGMDLSNHKIRHLSIENESLESYPDNNGTLRTLIVLPENNIDVNDMLQRNITRLRHLRYLGVTLFWPREEFLLPDRLRNLVCLRHLELHINEKIKLPKSFGDLYNLVVLEITCRELVELPDTLTNLVSLTTIYFCGFLVDHLPALGELPSLKSLTLVDFNNVRSIGNEFCRGRNNRWCVAFPSLTSLVFKDMSNWKTWYALWEGDFLQLEKLEINGCGMLSSLPSLGNLISLRRMSLTRLWLHRSLWLSPVCSFPQNLRTLESSCHSELSLPQGFGGLKKLERLTGTFRVRTDELFGILKNLASLKYLILSRLPNAHSAWNDEGRLKEYCSIEKLVLNWSPFSDLEYYLNRDKDLQLVVESDENNQTKNASLFILEKLQPRTNLEELCIIGYEGFRYPRWIGHPSFDKLNEVSLRRCKIEQLPTLGQLPSLKHLHLHSIDLLKRIGSEFCRGVNSNPSHGAVAFPSLIELAFEEMYQWEKWDGVRRYDFPKLEYLSIYGCPNLSLIYYYPAKLENLSIYGCPRLSLPHNCSAKQLHLENEKVILRVRNDELYRAGH